MKFKVLFTLLSLVVSTMLFAQNRLDSSVSFSSEMTVDSHEKEVLVTVKKLGNHTYMDFKHKGKFFQVNLSSLDKEALFTGYETLKGKGLKGKNGIINSELTSSIGFNAKGAYKVSPNCQVTFSVLNKNDAYFLVIHFPKTHDTQSQNMVFESRTVVISDANVQLFEKALLEKATFVSIHVHN